MNELGWASTPRGRKELLAVGLFCLTFAVVPLLTTELYPFSRAPMFGDAPRLYCDYVVRLPDGRQLTDETDKPTLTKLGVQRNYWGNPLGVGVGYEPPPTVDDFGKVADKELVVGMVAKRWNSSRTGATSKSCRPSSVRTPTAGSSVSRGKSGV